MIFIVSNVYQSIRKNRGIYFSSLYLKIKNYIYTINSLELSQKSDLVLFIRILLVIPRI